jgi:integrase
MEGQFVPRACSGSVDKLKRAREIPLTDYAIQLFESLPRISGFPFVFVNVETRRVVKEPRRPLYQGRKDAKLPWVGFDDFRHFRATQWILYGMDIRTVQGFRHDDIETTIRYPHFSPEHAAKRVLEVQKAEAAELLANRQETGNDEHSATVPVSLSAASSLFSLTGTQGFEPR